MENFLKNRLQLLAEINGLSDRAFAKIIGKSPSYLKNVKDNTGLDVVRNILTEYPTLSLQWLIFGTGDMYVNETDEAIQKKKNDYSISLKDLKQQLSALTEENRRLHEALLKYVETNANMIVELTKLQTEARVSESFTDESEDKNNGLITD